MTGATTGAMTSLADLKPEFDHTAHAAPSLRDMLPIYHDLLGGRLTVGADNRMTGFRVLQLRMPDGTKMELIEPLKGSTFLDSFFARTKGRGGLHHITFLVDSVQVATERLEESGLGSMGYFAGSEELPAQVFIHPAKGAGALVQFVERGFEPPSELPSLDEVLAGRGLSGTGDASPPATSAE